MTHAATLSPNVASLPQFRVAQSWPDRLVFVCFGMISAGHTQGLKAQPDAYQARVLGWFDTHLLQQAR